MKKMTSPRPSYSQEDKKFYEFRIMELFQSMMENKVHSNIPDILTDTFDLFVGKCIDHFQLLDKNDFIQQEFQNETFVQPETETEPPLIDLSLNEINKKFYLRPKKGKFEKRIINVNTTGSDNIVSVNPFIILPKERDYNLRAPELQHKKNVYVTYETSHHQENTKEEISTVEKVEMQSQTECEPIHVL